MKIVVDKLPERMWDCRFSEYNTGDLYFSCKLDDKICPMSYLHKCDKCVESSEICLVRPTEE